MGRLLVSLSCHRLLGKVADLVLELYEMGCDHERSNVVQLPVIQDADAMHAVACSKGQIEPEGGQEIIDRIVLDDGDADFQGDVEILAELVTDPRV